MSTILACRGEIVELGHTLATPLRKFDKLESGNTHTVCATGGSMHQKKIE